MNNALGLIETLGITAAVAAVDAACKAADVTLIGTEKIIGVGTLVGVNIQFAGEVSAVTAAVDAGVDAAMRVGSVASSKVMARPHDELDSLIAKFGKNLKSNEKDQEKGKTSEKSNLKEVKPEKDTKKEEAKKEKV